MPRFADGRKSSVARRSRLRRAVLFADAVPAGMTGLAAGTIPAGRFADESA